MQTFKIKEGGFKEIKKQALLRMVPIMIIVVSLGIVISFINSDDKATSIKVLPFVVTLVGVAGGLAINRGINRQKALFDSYTLTITNNLITREQLNTPTVSIYFNDIKQIVKNKNGSFLIKSKGAADLIGVPAQIEHYLQLEETLQNIQPIIGKDKLPFLQKYPASLGLLTVGLMLCVYISNNKIIVGITGTAFVALMIWGVIKIRSSNNVDSRTKNGLWWVAIVLASVIAIMIFKLTGVVDMQRH